MSLRSVMPVVVAYNSYPWIRVGVQSFRRHFPLTPLLVIDNNPDPGMPGYGDRTAFEQSWLRDWCSTDFYSHLGKTIFSNKEHGEAINWAVRWCRERAIRWMIHFEPDCLITGVEWARALMEATRQDPWMAGSHRKSFGPIHPTPSIWDVTKVVARFEKQLRGDDVYHPRYSEVVDLEALASHIKDQDRNFWETYWDTAQKPWFEAAVRDKALLVRETDDFRHFWQGSTLNLDPEKENNPLVSQYL